jgi:hypothetical protein
MMGMSRYLDAYIDRRMQAVITEWDLATARDLGDLSRRLETLEQGISSVQENDKKAAAALGELEARVLCRDHQGLHTNQGPMTSYFSA